MTWNMFFYDPSYINLKNSSNFKIERIFNKLQLITNCKGIIENQVIKNYSNLEYKY